MSGPLLARIAPQQRREALTAMESVALDGKRCQQRLRLPRAQFDDLVPGPDLDASEYIELNLASHVRKL